MNIKTALHLMALLAITFVATGLSVSAAPPLPDRSTASRARPAMLRPLADNPSPPTETVKLIFIHHSCGENWLDDGNGGLGITLRDNNYFVSDSNYGWGPDSIGSNTDIGHWWSWFRGTKSATYLGALYTEYGDHSYVYSRRADPDPSRENQIIMFKSCYPNSELQGSSSDPIPAIGSNPLREQESSSNHHTISNAKGIYNDLLNYFGTRQDKLFVAITAPPVSDNESADNARAFNTWLVEDWLDSYPHNNVAVWDFYNVLTSNGGDPDTNDYGQAGGNHHRWNATTQTIEYITNQGGNTTAYPTDDPHPSAAGNQKATGEYVPLLNVFYRRWTGGQPPPTYDHRIYLPLILRQVGSTPTPPPPTDGCPLYPPGFSLVMGTQVYPLPVAAEPAPRQWYTEPTFGTCLVRVTDRANDPSAGDPSTGLKNEYARVQAFNADDSRIVVRGTEGSWYLYDALTLLPLAELPLEAEPRWDATDPHLLYYTDETRLMSYNVQTAGHSTIRDFAADFPGQNLAAVWTRHEGRPSRDSRYWGFMAQDQDWLAVGFVVYDRSTDQVTVRDMRGVPGVDDGIDHVTISPLGTYFLASFDRSCQEGQLGSDANPCGLVVYDRDLTNGRSLLRTIGHYDPGLDAQGREVIVYQDIDTDHISMLDLATGAVTPLWAIDYSHTAIGLHFSGLAYDQPGWALISTHDDDPVIHTWMDDQVFAVELRAGGRVVRLAHTHSLRDDEQELDYWAEPHASVNHDFTRVVFGTNWGRTGTGQVEMYLIALPQGWPSLLP